MRILIKGMGMPTHCLNCPFMVSIDSDYCILQSAEANENFENWEQMKTGCPLVSVPPIVRCKDCKHCDKVDDYEYWCNGRGLPRGLVAPDGFCDKGKMEGEK